MPLPSLDAFPETVREQLRDQHASLLSLAGRQSPDPARLGLAYGVMGQLLLAYDLGHAAEPALLNAADLLPKDVRWPYYLGHLYQGDAQLERAAHNFERVFALQPEYVAARIYLAEVYRDLGREADAKVLLHETLRMDPQNAAAYLLLGQMAAADDDLAQAIEYYETVLRLQPAASVARYPLALAYRKRGDLDRSREHLARRGQTRVRIRDPHFEDLERVRKGSGAKIFKGNLLLGQRRYREAAVFFEQAAAEDSANLSAHLNLGLAVAQLGEVQSAIQAMERVLRVDPSNSSAHYNLGVLFGLQGEEEKALEHFRAAVDRDPGSTVARIALANFLWRKRQCQEAIPHFDNFLTERPGHVEARTRQAICHAHLGEYARARELIEAGHEAFPQEPRFQGAMVRLLAASPEAGVRDGERALEIAERLTATHRHPETLESLAMAYAEVGRFSEAIQYQQEVIRAAERTGMATSMLDYLRNNLLRYEKAMPCRTPWPPMVFDQ